MGRERARAAQGAAPLKIRGRFEALAGALLGIAAVPASAAIRHATPSPAPGADCSAATPCSLQTAIDQANGGDEIVIGPGTYAVSASLNNARSLLHIRGVPGEPRPTIVSSVQNGATLHLRGGSLRHVSIELTKNGAHGAAAADLPVEIEDVTVSAPTSVVAIGIDLFQADGSTVENAAIDTGGFGATGVYVRRSTGVELRHITALARGTSGRAVYVAGAIDRDASARIRNSIMVGGQSDLEVSEGEPFQASADVDWSNLVGSAGQAGTCSATVGLGRSGRRAASVTLAAGRQATARIRLTRSALGTLRRTGRLRMRVTVTSGGRATRRAIVLRTSR